MTLLAGGGGREGDERAVSLVCFGTVAKRLLTIELCSIGGHWRVITLVECDSIIEDPSKRIEGDLVWRALDDHRPACMFREPVLSDEGYPLEVVGRLNPMVGKLSYVLLYRGAGRIYGLDLGSAHRNPDGERVGDKHKHKWTADYRDKWAYVPEDITAPWDRPLEVWQQFCVEARINHHGLLSEPSIQGSLL